MQLLFYFALYAEWLPRAVACCGIFTTDKDSGAVAGSVIPTTITRFVRGCLGWRVLYSTEQEEAETIAINAIATKLILEDFFIFIFFVILNKYFSLKLFQIF